MSVRDGQMLGVLDIVSVTVNCLVSHRHGDACQLGFRLTGRRVQRSVTHYSPVDPHTSLSPLQV